MMCMCDLFLPLYKSEEAVYPLYLEFRNKKIYMMRVVLHTHTHTHTQHPPFVTF